MYGPLLFVHSWVRWVVLALFVVALLPSDRKLRLRAVALVSAVDLQVLLGLTLWLFSSPLTHLAFSQRLLFTGAPFTFFGLFHPVVMLVALTWLHVANVRLRTGGSRTTWQRSVFGALVLVLLAVPWPVWSFGRPLVPSLPRGATRETDVTSRSTPAEGAAW